MTRAEKAKDYFSRGYACSQAVALAFADLMQISEDQIEKIMLPFGGGLGRMRLTCGAVSGMAAVAGMVLSDGKNKSETYALIREMAAKFEAELGSLICADLLSGANLNFEKGGNPEKRSDEYYKKRPCAEIVFVAASIIEDELAKNKDKPPIS